MKYFSNGGQSRILRNYQRKYFIASFHTLEPYLKIPNLLVAVKSHDQRVIGASGLETIESFMRLMSRKRL